MARGRKGAKPGSILSKHVRILVIAVTLVFLGGIGIVLLNAYQNWAYIYQLLESSLEASVTQIEDRISQYEQISYDIITDNDMQAAGSALLDYYDREAEGESGQTPYTKAVAINDLTLAIRSKIEGNNGILCANYISLEGIQYTIDNSQYVRFGEELFTQIEQAARTASGSAVQLHFNTEEYRDYLVIARLIREKRGQSLREIGIVYLVVDMRQVTQFYRESNGYGLVVDGLDGAPMYEFMDALDPLPDGVDLSTIDRNSQSLRVGREFYVAALVRPEGSAYQYMVISTATGLYRSYERALKLLLLLYSVVMLLIVAMAYFNTRNVTSQLSRLVEYIQNTPVRTKHIAESEDGYTQIAPHTIEGLNSVEAIQLKKAYDDMAERINGLVRENYMQVLLVKETEIAALQAQFNPHFLYNTLNSVYWMAKTAGRQDIVDMVRSLSSLTRGAIGDGHYVVPLETELEFVHHYITIQKLRYDTRFTLDLQVHTASRNVAVPKFTIQPLLENAFTYGVENMLEPCEITVAVYDEGEMLCCEVANTGPPIDEDIMEKLRNKTVQPKGNGIGLLNIDRRIKSLFGQRCGITVHNEAGRAVVRATLRRVAMEEYILADGERGNG